MESEKLKILLYSLNYAPELIGIGKYNTELLTWLSKQGHAVQVICAPPYYPHWKVQKGHSSYRYCSEVIDKVTIWRCPVWIPKQPNGIRRILHLLTFAIFSLPILLWRAFKWKPDVIFTLEPPLFCLPGALLVSWLAKCSLWLHVQDFELDAAFSLGFIPSFRPIRYLSYRLESWLLKQLKVVSTISDEMTKVLHKKGVQPENILLVPNWVDTQIIAPTKGDGFYREKLGIEASQIVCLYSGNLGEKQGLGIIVDAAKHLREDRQIVFVIAGEGPSKLKLMQRAEGVRSIKFLDLQHSDRFNALLNMADIHLLPQLMNTNSLFFPSKLKAMFASGRPVIASVNPMTEIAKVVSSRGIVVPPEDPLLMSKAIKYLVEDDAQRKLLGSRARQYAVENWAKDNVLNNLNQKLQEIIDKSNRRKVRATN